MTLKRYQKRRLLLSVAAFHARPMTWQEITGLTIVPVPERD